MNEKDDTKFNEMNEINDHEVLIGKAKYFKDSKTKVHVKTTDGWFSNGLILDIKADFIIINDRVLGEKPIFFLEIKDIQPFVDKQRIDGKFN